MTRLLSLCLPLIFIGGCVTAPPVTEKVAAAAEPQYLSPIGHVPEALGPLTWPVTTSSTLAQQLFDQGMQLRWSYNVNEASRSMASARRADPDCAMCYWGEAFALGSFLNGAMSAEKAAHAHTAIENSARLAHLGTSVEQDLIAAARVRYPASYDPAGRRAVDQAFADAMAAVHAKHPTHAQVAVVYAVALFLLEDRAGYRDVNDPDVKRLHKVLTDVLDRDVKHTGACHLFIHATESSQHPEWALPCAEFLGQSVPIASHIQHMPSHTWNEVGLWGRSVRANISAQHSDLRATELGAGFSYGESHNLHMLLYAASYDGQGAVATQAGKDYRKVTGNAMYEALTLLRFGRFDEVVLLNDQPENPVFAALWTFAKGYASLRSGNPGPANTARDELLAFAAETDLSFRYSQPAAPVVGTVAHILEGEIRWHDGDLTGAIDSFEAAVEREDAMGYAEPEALPFAARHWLGAALHAAGDYAAAEQTYRDELDDHPHNGWSLRGLTTAVAAQHRTDPAADDDLAKSWQRSDIFITTSKF